jgi:hypothetical protein
MPNGPWYLRRVSAFAAHRIRRLVRCPPKTRSAAGPASSPRKPRPPATRPAGWIYTVQGLHGPSRAAAIEALPALGAPGGTLLVIARATDDQDPVRDPALMPWPLTRRELEAMVGRTPG